MALDLLSPQELRQRCSARATDLSHERFCFELFKRAITQKDERCWQHICEHYQVMVMAWLRKGMPTGWIGDKSVSELAFCPFEKFWRSFDSAHLAKARDVAAILAFLRTCVITCIQDARRENYRNQLRQPNDENETEDPRSEIEKIVLEDIWREQLWNTILAICNNRQEQLVARLSLTTNLKPSQIFELYPNDFCDVDEVYRVKRNLFARIGRSEAIRQLWEEKIG